MEIVQYCINHGSVESFQGFIKDMAKVLYGKAHTYAKLQKSFTGYMNIIS
ncbi:hypothetical protein ACTNED_10060 [Absicoccus porci]